ncbi:MAG: shikimate kinase [Bacteroidaceae bacterium]|nr:shikimate kinase [Bacteroidaceae bacterium]MCF0199280.1 shikimate kinase [Bacteroidaceae bacterium]
MQQSIILIGYMGAGKTTVGRQLALSLGWQFYDLDWYIETRFHKSVDLIFQEMGEEGFRDLERRMLHEAAEFQNIVLSCGGGTPCFYDNMDYMNSLAETVYLKVDPEVLAMHLRMGKTIRPLIKGKTPEELVDYIRGTLAQREPFYTKAKHTIDVSLMDNYEKIAITVKLLKEELGLA